MDWAALLSEMCCALSNFLWCFSSSPCAMLISSIFQLLMVMPFFYRALLGFYYVCYVMCACATAISLWVPELLLLAFPIKWIPSFQANRQSNRAMPPSPLHLRIPQVCNLIVPSSTRPHLLHGWRFFHYHAKNPLPLQHTSDIFLTRENSMWRICKIKVFFCQEALPKEKDRPSGFIS